ncbi:MAG: hypothetical protein IKJ41_07955 [Clostridia bacterium]|nr:hypothetical protein [Clostridia bacterium]
MRIFRINYNEAGNLLPDGSVLGNQGEHNATLLTVTPPDEMTENEKITSYRIAFELTNCRAVHSESIAKADVISLPLFSQITSSETVAVQLEGYDENGDVIVKSPKIKKLKFNPSVCGVEIPLSDSPNSMAAEVTANTAFRNNFKEDEKGNLTYKGQPITERKTFLIEGTTDEYFLPLYTISNAVTLYINKSTCETEDNEIINLENKEIKTIYFNINGTLVDIKNLSAYDGKSYIVNIEKLVFDTNSGLLHALTLYCPFDDSILIQNLQNYESMSFKLELYE